MSGVVSHHISEGTVAQDLKLDVKDTKDPTLILLPDVKNGNVLVANYMFSHLGINAN